jgi:hypothetical protein
MSAPFLEELVCGQIWLREYPIRYRGIRVNARMMLVRLGGGGVIIHSPCPFDEDLAQAVARLGPVEAIIAPGDFHHLYVPSCQAAFPRARTFICPGVEKRQPELPFDEVLGDGAPPLWAGEIDRVLIRGTAYLREVVFFHRPSKTLIGVDIIENIGDSTPGTNWMLRMWFVLLRMWNRPAPAPEYWLGWRDKEAVRACLERVLEWDFERVILAHGELITQNARQVVHRAWRKVVDERDHA